MKKAAVASLALIGFVFLVLVLVFVYRQPVAVFAIERVLANTSVTLEQMEGLELGWNSVQVKKLALRMDGFQQPIGISGIDVGFSLADAQLEAITIDHLSIPAYLGADQPESGKIQQATIEDLIRTLHSLPLPDLRIHGVSWEQQEVAQQLRWQRGDGDQTLAFKSRDLLCTLSLATILEPVAELEGRVHLRRGADDLLVSQFDMKKEGPAYLGMLTLEISQPGWTEALATVEKTPAGVDPGHRCRGQADFVIASQYPGQSGYGAATGDCGNDYTRCRYEPGIHRYKSDIVSTANTGQTQSTHIPCCPQLGGVNG